MGISFSRYQGVFSELDEEVDWYGFENERRQKQLLDVYLQFTAVKYSYICFWLLLLKFLIKLLMSSLQVLQTFLL